MGDGEVNKTINVSAANGVRCETRFTYEVAFVFRDGIG